MKGDGDFGSCGFGSGLSKTGSGERLGGELWPPYGKSLCGLLGGYIALGVFVTSQPCSGQWVFKMNRDTLAITAGLLIDGTGRQALKDPVLLVEGEQIFKVGQKGDVAVPGDAKVIDGSGLTLLPGLVDAHIHLTGNRPRDITAQFDEVLGTVRAVADAQLLLDHGVTAARCCGSYFTPSIKLAVEQGTIPGPRFMAARAAVSQTCGHADTHHLPLDWVREHGTRIGVLADGVEECIRAVREQFRGRADLIKLMLSGGTGSQLDELEYPQFSTDEIRAMVKEAHLNGRRVAAHAHGLAGIRNAVNEGIDSIEHGSAIDEESARRVASEGKFIVPTCYIPLRTFERTKGFKEVGEMAEWTFRRQRTNYEFNRIRVSMCRKLGCKQAVGTDWNGSSPYELAKEVWAMSELGGYSAVEAVSCCTKIGAETLGLEGRIGTLEAGKLADLVLFEGDPLQDLRRLGERERIRVVMKGGRVVINRGVKLST